MTEVEPIGKLGYINRKVDISNVSGTGRVAEFVEYGNRVIVQWITGKIKSTVTYDNIEEVKQVMCSGGNSEIVYYEQKKIDYEMKELEIRLEQSYFSCKERILNDREDKLNYREEKLDDREEKLNYREEKLNEGKQKLNKIKKAFILFLSFEHTDYKRLREKIDNTINEKKIDCDIYETKDDVLYLFNKIKDKNICNKYMITNNLKHNIKYHTKALDRDTKEYSKKTGIPEGYISDHGSESSDENDDDDHDKCWCIFEKNEPYVCLFTDRCPCILKDHCSCDYH